jgi:predicted aldo/keto reductase-like oxidoreductase
VTGNQWQLTEAEKREIERLREELGTQFCQHCDYCQPCIEEIPISTVMNIRSLAEELPPEEFFSGTMVEAVEKVAYCTECADCEERCPFDLSIRQTLAKEAKWFEEEKSKFQERVTNRSS